ncbi:GNAT family N-acetyltransferase [Rufibacter psychrotolerans]|uniref:GNAT family N-acetyltransferase n=1 Tax=Rufibacter psychrotolerans TaxID=2812556 RepID=UPI001967A2A3|nr:GNAT family N-acetyltransferase [Rufibacter sp. SYSU D00308]
MQFAFADALSVTELCTLFNTAFSDYVQPMVLTEPILELKLTRDGTQLGVSPLALDHHAAVGFILNALGDWQGRKTAYNGGTGVVPEARGQALAERMYQFCLPVLQQEGVEQCLLEVIKENTRAFLVYQRLGFEVVRHFRCFRDTKTHLQWHGHAAKEIELREVAHPDWALYQTFWEVEPSWQYHTAAVDRSLAHVKIVEAHHLGRCVGYGMVYPLTGAVAQLAVSPAWRRNGVGQALLQRLAELATAPAISVINVDEQSNSTLQFLQNRKMTEIMGQYEMIRPV